MFRSVFWLIIALSLVACSTRTVTYYEPGQPAYRVYSLDYHETVLLLCDVAAVEVFLDGELLGVTPFEHPWSPGSVTVDEFGFQDATVTREQNVLVFDTLWGKDVERETRRVGVGGLPASSHLAHTVTEPNGTAVGLGAETRSVERFGPVRWEGGRNYVTNLEPLLLELRFPDGQVGTLNIEPTLEDDALGTAIASATWNDEANRPADLHGKRYVQIDLPGD